MTDEERHRPKVCAVLCTILGTRDRSARGSRVQEVVECVESIVANPYEPLEIVVVDQSPGTELASALQGLVERDRRLRVIRSDRPGLTRSQNLAIQSSDAAIFAFTDDDCIVPPDWIPRIVEVLRRHPEAGLLFGEVCLPRGHDWTTTYVPHLHWDAEVELRPSFLPRVHSLMGANMAARRETFQRIGLLEEAFSPHPINGEVELALRATRAHPPIPIYLTPAFSVVHQYGARPAGEASRQLLHTYHMGSTILVTTHALRGDLGAACKLVLMGFEPLADTIVGVLRTGKPHGLRKVVPYVQGIARGVRGVVRAGAGVPPPLERG